MSMHKSVVWLTQVVTYGVFSIPFRLLFKIRRKGSCGFAKPCIIASNHTARLDPFLVVFSLSIADFLRIIPIRFITADIYLRDPFSKLFLLPLGCVSTEGKVLHRASALLDQGHSLYIFPTGKIKRKKPKVGVAYLERAASNAQIIPVHIRGSDRISFGTVFSRESLVTVTFHPPFRHDSFPDDLQPLANDVMRRIHGTRH